MSNETKRLITLNGEQHALEGLKVPDDRAFRDAWSVGKGSVVEIDMEAARKIWQDKIRAARAEAFAELDIRFMAAIERGDEEAKQEIAVLKQALRDAPNVPDIAKAKTPKALKKIQPAGLKVE